MCGVWSTWRSGCADSWGGADRVDIRTEYVVCDLCGSDQYRLLFCARDTRTHLVHRQFPLVQCEKCGLVFVNPRPTREELEKLYPPGEYYSLQEPGTMWQGGRGKLKSYAIRFISGRHDTALAKLGTLLLGRMISVSVPHIQGGRILDIGCGSGAYLDLMQEVGWETYGVEPSEVGAKWARANGHDVFCGELLDARYPSAFFDAILMHHVLEHVPNPGAVLHECHRILKGGGLVLVNVPNFDCYDRVTFAESWDPLDVPRHLYHFSISTLRQALEQAGFEVMRFRYRTWFTSRQFYSSSFRSLKESNSSRRRLVRAYIRTFLLKPVQFLFSTNRGQRFAVTMTAYARKMAEGDQSGSHG
jgi:SAM-dependent methyltransferase